MQHLQKKCPVFIEVNDYYFLKKLLYMLYRVIWVIMKNEVGIEFDRRVQFYRWLGKVSLCSGGIWAET